MHPRPPQAAAELAEALGLHAEAARAAQVLGVRRQRAEEALAELAERGSATEVAAAVLDAKALGLSEAAAAAAETRLVQRRGQAARQLHQLVDHVGDSATCCCLLGDGNLLASPLCPPSYLLA